MVQRIQLIASAIRSADCGGNETAGQFEQALREIGALLVAGAEPFELVQQGEVAIDDPAHVAQSGLGDAASGVQQLDAPLSQQAAVLVEVVATVRIQTSGLAAGPSPGSPTRRNRVEQVQELGDVVPVAAGEREIRWCLKPGRARSTG